MLRHLIRNTVYRVTSVVSRSVSNETNLPEDKSVQVQEQYQVLDTRDVFTDDRIDYRSQQSSVLDKCQEDISHVAPYLKPTFNFAAYVNKSKTLKQLVNLGVNLYKIEKNVEAVPFLLKLDFERDIKAYIIFLHDLGLETDDIADLITKNPLIFKESLDNLNTRINYLKYKKFSNEMICRIVQKNHQWLSFSTQDIDKKLGFFQKTYLLTGNEVRLLATKKPKLITYSERLIKLNNFVIKEEMGFSAQEMKQMLLEKPNLYMKDQNFILKTFEYVHKTMNIPLETIARMPGILTCREFRVRQRHMFLQKMGRDQFDPTKPNYVSPLSMVTGPDSDFATEIAGSSIQAFNAFLKSL